MDLNLTMGIGLSQKRPVSDLYQDPNLGQAAGSEVGGRAASYKVNDIPHTYNIEGVVINRDADEVNDSKRACGSGTTHLVRVPAGFHILILT